MVRSAAPWLMGIGLAAFYAAATAGLGFLYDDNLLVADQSMPHSIDDVARVLTEPHYGSLPYYRPVVRLTYVAQKALHGDEPGPYHLVNAALAGAVGVAAWFLMVTPWLTIGRAAATAGAALFVLHPVASSAVAPVAGRETLLAALFGIAAVAAHVRDGRAARVAAAGSLALALFSKENAIAVPLLFVLADVLRPAPGRTPIRVARYAPALAVVFAYVAARSLVLREAAPVALAVSHDPWGPVRAYAYAIQSWLAPAWDLVYEPSIVTWMSPPRLGLALASLSGLAWAGWNRRRDLAFWVGWFVVAQIPSANIVVQETLLDERYVFMASLGVAGGLARLASLNRFGVGALVALALAAGATSMHRATFFENADVFHRQWLATNPRSPSALNGLGAALVAQGRLDEGIVRLEAALSIQPNHPQALNNLGVALERSGRLDEAETRLRDAVRADPRHAEARFNLANVVAARGRLDEAEASYREALRLRPDYRAALNNLAAAVLRAGRTEEAIVLFRRALAIEPGRARAHAHLGVALARAGRWEEALQAHERALVLDPRFADAHLNVAGALRALGRFRESADQYRSAIRLRPESIEARAGLAWILVEGPDLALHDPREALLVLDGIAAMQGDPDPEILRLTATARARMAAAAGAATGRSTEEDR